MGKIKTDSGSGLESSEGQPETSGAISGSSKEEIKLDKWQEEVIEHEGNIALRAGRQVGKSTAIAIKAAKYATQNKKQSIMIISATERQAYLLFSKVLGYLMDNYRQWIKRGKDRPTKTEIKLNNKSIIRCLPTGLDGIGIRGYTVNLLIADEAAFIPEAVWPAVSPMLATTGGKIILLSTPMGKQGYFYTCFQDKRFRTWHVNAEEIAETRLEPQRTFMREHQEAEKERMSKAQYAAEYLGEWRDELQRMFSDDLVKATCILKRRPVTLYERNYFLGCDIARMGEDAGTYEILDKVNKDRIEQVDSIVTRKKLTTETYDKILELDKIYRFKKIGIDAGSGSLGVGILDFLLRSHVKRKVIALNNLTRQMDAEGKKKKSLMKEDMYMNMLAMMEKNKLKLLNDDDVIASLRSVQYEYVQKTGKQTTIRIFGRDTHIAEGLIRAAWLANQKHLNAFVDWH